MGLGGFGHWILLALLVLLLFGGARFSNMMGDVAKGLKNFKKGMADEDEEKARNAPPSQAQIPPQQQQPIDITPQQRPVEQTPPPPPPSDNRTS